MHDACFDTEHNSFWYQHRNRCVVAMVRRHPPSGPILDVGGGNGYVALGLRSAGFAAIVLEPGERGARNALQRGLSPVIHGTLQSADFEDESLPAVGLFDVLEHIEDAEGFLDYLRTRLAPAGRIYLTVPAYMSLWSDEDVDAGHVRRYTLTSLCRLLQAHGFAIDFGSYIFVPLPLPIALLRAIPSRLALRRRPDASASDHVRGARPLRRLLAAGLSLEEWYLRRGISLPFGASVLVAAHKVRSTA
jgi:SAM-dependent methyltransferase